MAEVSLSIAHLYEQYAGGSGCFDVFLVGAPGLTKKITDLEIGIEVFSKSGEPNPIKGTLKVDSLGGVPADQKVETAVELPSCSDGKPKIVVTSATGTIQGTRVDFLKSGQLHVSKIVQYPVQIQNPTSHSTRPAAGQLSR
jgi:hypothetical protein